MPQTGPIRGEGDHPPCTERSEGRAGKPAWSPSGAAQRRRRSSPCGRGQEQAPNATNQRGGLPPQSAPGQAVAAATACTDQPGLRIASKTVFTLVPAWAKRSEEHTSELQSLMRISYAVFCLKKKNDTK